jgi:hypothetical protein
VESAATVVRRVLRQHGVSEETIREESARARSGEA